MDNVYEWTLNDFIEKASSSSHVPGGGNVSAVVGTLGASMVSMVANLTIGKKKYAEFEEEAKEIIVNVQKGIDRLKDLTFADMKAFDDYMQCFKMPKESDEEKAARREAIQTAAKQATLVPLEVCEACVDLMEEASKLSKFGNKSAISDVGVGSYILQAALNACMLAVDINIPTIKDEEFVRDVTSRRAILINKTYELRDDTLVHMRSIIK